MTDQDSQPRGFWRETGEMIGGALLYARDLVLAWSAHLWKVRIDVVIACALGAAAAAFALWRLFAFDFSVLSSVIDLWFEGDAPRIIEGNADRWSQMHYRSSVHPLFALLISFPLVTLTKLGLSTEQVTATCVGAGAFAFSAAFYTAARSVGLRRIDSFVIWMLMLSTAAAMFWLIVPESYAFGGATILLSLIWLAQSRGAHDAVSGPVQSALALSMTVTNWMAGLTAAVIALGPRRGVWISVIGFVIVVSLAFVQQGLFPESGKIFDFTEEGRYVSSEPARLGTRLPTLFSQTFIAPIPTALFNELQQMTIGFGAPALTPIFWVAALGWLLLALLAIDALRKRAFTPRILAFLSVVLAGQIVLHIFYGDSYFLYGLHFAPLVVLLAGAALLGARRRIALGLMAVTAIATGAHNLGQVQSATTLLNSYPLRMLEQRSDQDARGEVLWAMHQRPDDPWPTSAGHIIWGAPGAPLAEKGFLEPGGSLSPRPGGPGLSLWIYDESGALLATSDQQDAAEATQKFALVEGDTAPRLDIEAPLYRAQWRQLAPNRWRLDATSVGDPRGLMLSVRGIGPAAGPLREIAADGQDGVRADSCWRVRVRGGRLAFLGEEGTEGWRGAAQTTIPVSYASSAGWAAARLASPQAGALTAEIEQICARGEAPRWPLAGGIRVTPADLPIAEMLSEQTAHLLMGVEGDQTRPGDALTYPLQWLRDGAYTVVGMARAGRLDVARDLVTVFAEEDFFGGFGSEADSPGISLWTIGEVATALRDPSFDQRMWPHVRRKADFILELLAARHDVRRPFTGPATENRPDIDLVARAASGGLIVGRMDWQEPLLFVNGFAWRGLLDAAEIAGRVGAEEDAARWRASAQDLHAAWRRKFRAEGLFNERTAASLIWPTRAATQDMPMVRASLAALPATYDARPPWTYFEVARAHQYLAIGEVERAWSLIEALVGMSAFPSLGVLWEGNGGGEDEWRNYRGSVHAPPTAPHYWSAAELMLFAIEGLALIDETDGRTLVIGAGVRHDWLTQPIAVTGVGTLAGVVDWRWDGHNVIVALDDPSIPLRLGPAFPAGAPIIRQVRTS